MNNTPFHIQVRDPEQRPMLRQQALQDLEQANEQLAELQRAEPYIPDTLQMQMEASSLRFKISRDRGSALSRLKILDKADATRCQRWAPAVEGWSAAFAMLIATGYGMVGAVVVLASVGAAAALIHLLKAIAIAFAVVWLGRRLRLWLARR